MIPFKKFSDIVNKISKKFKIPKNTPLRVAQKAEERGINLIKWQQYLSMLGTFANTIPAENDPRIKERVEGYTEEEWGDILFAKELKLRQLTERVSKSDLDQIEKYADRLFGALDIDVEFTRHFLDRVNDKRNKRPIVPSELTRLFKQTYKKYGKTIRKLGPDAEAVISDMKTDINMPFVLNLKGGELELVAKTVMRKKDFKTSNPKLAFESKGFFTRGKTPEQKGKTLLRIMKSDLEKKLKGVPHSLTPDKTGTQIVIKVKSSDVDKTKKLVGLPNITQVVSERKTIKVGEDALLGDGNPHYALVSDRRVLATGTKEDMLELSDETGGRVWLTKSDIGDICDT